MPTRIEHYKRGMALFGENKFEQAIEAYEQALAASPDWTEALHGLAMSQMQAARVDDAIATGKRIVELDKEDAFAHTSLSMFYQKKSQVIEREAKRRRDAGDLSPNDFERARTQAAELIKLAEDESAKARMISWKEELKKNPKASPPGPAGSMDVIQ